MQVEVSCTYWLFVTLSHEIVRCDLSIKRFLFCIALSDVSFNHGLRLSKLTMFPAFSLMKHIKSLPKIEKRS